MARTATKKLKFRWSNGTYHSRPERRSQPVNNAGGTVAPGNGPQNLGRGNLGQALRPQAAQVFRPNASPGAGSVGSIAPVKPPAGAPGAPGTPGAPAPVTDPFAAHVGDSASTILGVGAAGAGYQSTAAAADAQLAESLRQYGIAQTSVADPVTGRKFRIDLEGNPYSVAGQIKHDIDQRRRSDINNMAAGGYILDGAMSGVIQATNRAEGSAYDDLFNRATAAVNQTGATKSTAYTDALQTVAGLRGADADRAATTIPDTTKAKPKKPKAPAKPKPKPTTGANTHHGNGNTKARKKQTFRPDRQKKHKAKLEAAR